MAKKGDVVVGLDIGTTKICAIVGEKTQTGIDIVGIGSSHSTGLKKGVVINIDSTVESIKKAVEEAELMAGTEISSVYCGISGGHIKGLNSHGIVAVKDKEVREMDVRRVLDAAKAIAIPLDREVIHIIPQEYVVDHQGGIKDPLGMSGVRLEAKVHIVTGAVSSAQNIIKCANRTGLNVSDIVLQQIASSEAVLSPDEKELGVALVDIGGGTTDIAIFSNGSIVHTAVLSLGGNHITNDLAVGLRTASQDAEKLKINYGCAMASMVNRDEKVEVQTVGQKHSRSYSKRTISEIIEPRVEEIFSLVQKEIIKSGHEDLLASGIVITGGSTLLKGMTELAEMIFDLPVKRSVPKGFGGILDIVSSPMYSTGVGLVLYGAKDHQNVKFKIREKNIYRKVKSRMMDWITEIF
ncbi:MAG: cell division protein FtsA [Deltaproteobacteria bacterium RIFCSPHIGHO2_02_FULL_40_11]|nr:MAG: cell division protein FtsA [Deltaproteobacteria bacterium RIFCSPHIGHO2_02_FULL_40_11]